jgi:hypothetical protein
MIYILHDESFCEKLSIYIFQYIAMTRKFVADLRHAIIIKSKFTDYYTFSKAVDQLRTDSQCTITNRSGISQHGRHVYHGTSQTKKCTKQALCPVKHHAAVLTVQHPRLRCSTVQHL